MNERLFARLATLLAKEPVVLASVLHTRGATPRKRGARMLVTAAQSEFSIGGGLAEARVIAASRELLHSNSTSREIDIDLSGAADAAGVCGGRMQLVLRRWTGTDDSARARNIASTLAAGACVDLSAADLGAATATDRARPDDRLLIIGGGHCALALYELALHLDFDLWVFDEHAAQLNMAQFPLATRLSGDYSELPGAVDTSRRVHAVLLNRDFRADIAALSVLARHPPEFMSMMGSARRIAEVRAALPECAGALAHLTAPVGLPIGAHTPHEIAVSILAQVIANRHASPPPDCS